MDNFDFRLIHILCTFYPSVYTLLCAHAFFNGVYSPSCFSGFAKSLILNDVVSCQVKIANLSVNIYWLKNNQMIGWSVLLTILPN